MADYIKPVVFKLGNQAFGVDINLVQSIENQVNVVNVPNSVKYVKGIINLRGEVVPLYSLKRKFNMPEDTDAMSSIIVNNGEFKIALEVDEVLEISDIDPNKIQPMPFIAKTDDAQYLDRVANSEGNLIILLDVEQLLSKEEKVGVKKLTEDMN